MKNGLLKGVVVLGALLTALMVGNAWADGHGHGHGHGHGKQCVPVYYHKAKVHHGHYYVAPPVHYVHNYYAPVIAPPPVVQYRTYYVPYATTYVAPPPPPPGFAFSATINEPGFSLGIAAGN